MPFWLAVLLLIVGLLGVVLPAIPGVGFMWIVIAVYAAIGQFTEVTPLWFAVLTLLGIVGTTTELWMGHLGAKVGGASWRSTLAGLLGGLVGGLIGLAVGGIGAVPGAMVGAAAGVLLNEYRDRREWKAALKATLGMAVGFTLSIVVQLAIATTMFAIFVWLAWPY